MIYIDIQNTGSLIYIFRAHMIDADYENLIKFGSRDLEVYEFAYKEVCRWQKIYKFGTSGERTDKSGIKDIEISQGLCFFDNTLYDFKGKWIFIFIGKLCQK